MGVSLSWLAVKGKTPEAARGELGLRATGQSGEMFRSPVVGALSDAGWYLMVARGCGHRIIAAQVVERLSRDCEVLTCSIEEHVMFSRATGWRDGRQLWSVTHDGENGPQGVSEEGTLPAEYPAIRDRLSARQEAEGGADAGVDWLFEVPLVLLQGATGFKHDEASPAYEARGFELLESTRKSFLQRLFGR